MKKYIDDNNKATSVDLNEKDEITITQEQDVSALIDANKQEYNNTEKKWSDQLFGNKVASIPYTAIDYLNKQGIMKGFSVLDQKRLFAWLNDPENLYFRTKPGHL
tara:strand:+ start:283 stop:597 length:315 start_codon:yes stop_codon:yes gene_type:complete